jgi:hypothetical protein
MGILLDPEDAFTRSESRAFLQQNDEEIQRKLNQDRLDDIRARTIRDGKPRSQHKQGYRGKPTRGKKRSSKKQRNHGERHKS